MLGETVSPIEFVEIHGHHDEHDDHAMEGEEGGEIHGRLLIADGSEPRISILDLETGHVHLHELEVAAASATLYSSPSGRFVYAPFPAGPEDNDDRVQIFDGGVYMEAHGDHFDLVEDDVSELTLGTTDERPVHVSVHGGHVAIYHDGSGRAALFDEHELEEEGNAYEPVWIEAGLQHGAVVPLGEEYAVVTSNNPDYPETATSSLPLGAEVRTHGRRRRVSTRATARARVSTERRQTTTASCSAAPAACYSSRPTTGSSPTSSFPIHPA